MDRPGLDQFIAALKARTFYSESKGGKYDAVNKSSESGAWGKYQFIWSIWGKSINEFAQKNLYGKVTPEEFLKLDKLQEEFFEQVYAPQAYDWVKKHQDKNVRGLSIDEIAQLYHVSPKDTLAYIQGGKWDPPGEQTPVKKYLESGQQGMDEFEPDLRELSPVIFDDAAEKNRVVDNYLSKLDEIKNNPKMSDGAKEMHIRSLKQKMYDNGYDNFISNRVGTELNKFEDDRRFFEEFYDGIKGNLKQKSSGGRPYQHIEIKDEKTKAMVDILLEKNPELSKDIHKNNKGIYSFNVGMRTIGRPNLMEKYILDSVNKFTGKEYTSVNDFVEDKHHVSILPGPLNKTDKPISIIDNKNDIFIDQDFTVGNYQYEDAAIDTTKIQKREKELGQKEPVVDTEEKTAPVDTEQKQKEDSAKAEMEKEKALDDFMKWQVKMDEPDKLHYDKSDYKTEIPFEAIANAFVGMAGMEMADTDVPLFTEQVSAGIMDYTAKIAKISQMGLPPELEAKLKNDASSAYNGMMQNLVRASAGNRNLVLGNQGQLDMNRLQSNNQIAIADHQAKQEALGKYGEMMRYINEFDSRRDINNTQIKQSMAMNRRKMGEDLAFAGFSAMNDSLADWNANKPGSANHMLMSQIRQKAFGYDPEISDDGSGTRKGTRSYYERTVLEPLRANNENVDYLNQNIGTLDEGQRKFMNLIVSRTGDPGEVVKAMQFIKGNDPERVNTSNDERLQKAISEGNFDSLLFGDFDQRDYLSRDEQSVYEQRNIV